MTLKQVKKCLSVLSVRDRLIVMLAILGGMRPSEMLGLQWKHLNDIAAEVRQRLYRGNIDVPKTKLSWRTVALPDGVAENIAEWKKASPSTEPEAWVFPSETLKTPITRDNVWRRSIWPKLEAVGLGWANFQVMRRTHSTLMNGLKVDPKLLADQLGHTVDVNQNVYTLPDLSQRRDAVNLLEGALQNA